MGVSDDTQLRHFQAGVGKVSAEARAERIELVFELVPIIGIEPAADFPVPMEMDVDQLI
jgi:hypothetical protein